MLTEKKSYFIKYKNKKPTNKVLIKSSTNFLLIQERDLKKLKKKLKFLNKKPNNESLEDMIFAFTVAKFVNSNAIVIAKKLATLGIGVGQTNS